MDDKSKITNGLNDRPRNETISQTGAGLPDDSGHPVEVDEATVERVRRKLLGDAAAELQDEVRRDTDLPQKGSA